MLPAFARQSWTRERYPVVTDSHGNEDRPDFEADPAELVITGCSIQPGAPAEVLGDREAVRIAWTIYQPSGADVLATDFGRFDGVLYRVSGEPQRWTSASGALDHDVVLLEVWDG
jgi:hypothetical protein